MTRNDCSLATVLGAPRIWRLHSSGARRHLVNDALGGCGLGPCDADEYTKGKKVDSLPAFDTNDTNIGEYTKDDLDKLGGNAGPAFPASWTRCHQFVEAFSCC